jgi:hypothetical protein
VVAHQRWLVRISAALTGFPQPLQADAGIARPFPAESIYYME